MASQLVVVAVETGGRWSDEAHTFFWQLALARARDAPVKLRYCAALGWMRRWTTLLSVACGRAFADSLTRPCVDSVGVTPVDGAAPVLADLFGQLPREGVSAFGPPLRG